MFFEKIFIFLFIVWVINSLNQRDKRVKNLEHRVDCMEVRWEVRDTFEQALEEEDIYD